MPTTTAALDDYQICRRINDARARHGLTVVEMAARLDVPKAALTQ